MAQCGVELFGFDQLVPGDGRLEALTWSWASRRARQRRLRGLARLRRPLGDRLVPHARARRRAAPPTASGSSRKRCDKAGATFAAPRTARENQLLREAAGSRTVLLGLSGASMARSASPSFAHARQVGVRPTDRSFDAVSDERMVGLTPA